MPDAARDESALTPEQLQQSIRSGRGSQGTGTLSGRCAGSARLSMLRIEAHGRSTPIMALLRSFSPACSSPDRCTPTRDVSGQPIVGSSAPPRAGLDNGVIVGLDPIEQVAKIKYAEGNITQSQKQLEASAVSTVNVEPIGGIAQGLGARPRSRRRRRRTTETAFRPPF